MQVGEKSGDGLSKVFGVTVPAGELAKRLDARIAEITPRLNIKGFRPGKVPPAHIRRLHGKALMAEVVEQTVTETKQKVLDDNKLRAATEPNLTPEADMDKVLAGGEDLTFEMAVENGDDAARAFMGRADLQGISELAFSSENELQLRYQHCRVRR